MKRSEMVGDNKFTIKIPFLRWMRGKALSSGRVEDDGEGTLKRSGSRDIETA